MCYHVTHGKRICLEYKLQYLKHLEINVLMMVNCPHYAPRSCSPSFVQRFYPSLAQLKAYSSTYLGSRSPLLLVHLLPPEANRLAHLFNTGGLTCFMTTPTSSSICRKTSLFILDRSSFETSTSSILPKSTQYPKGGISTQQRNSPI